MAIKVVACGPDPSCPPCGPCSGCGIQDFDKIDFFITEPWWMADLPFYSGDQGECYKSKVFEDGFNSVLITILRGSKDDKCGFYINVSFYAYLDQDPWVCPCGENIPAETVRLYGSIFIPDEGGSIDGTHELTITGHGYCACDGGIDSNPISYNITISVSKQD